MPLTPGAILGLLSSQSLWILKYKWILACIIVVLFSDKIVAFIRHFVSLETAGIFECLAILGSTTKISKNRLVLPYQTCVNFDVSPVVYQSIIHVSTPEKVVQDVETIFTVGPDVEDHKKLLTYFKFFSANSITINQETVKSLIQQATTQSASELPLFNDVGEWIRRMKLSVNDKVVPKLDTLGYHVYFSDIRRMDIKSVTDINIAKNKFDIIHEKAQWELKEVKVMQTLTLAKGELEKIQARMDKEVELSSKIEGQEADVELYRKIRQAEACIYQSTAQVESLKTLAEGFQSMAQCCKILTASNDYSLVKDFITILDEINGQLKPNINQNGLDDAAVQGEEVGAVDGGGAGARENVEDTPIDDAGANEVGTLEEKVGAEEVGTPQKKVGAEEVGTPQEKVGGDMDDADAVDGS